MDKKKNIKYHLFVGILIILFVPMLFMQLSFIKIMPLKGAIAKIEKPDLSVVNWFSEAYQTQIEKYLNQNFGFRNFLVRLNNQLKYSFFNKAQANGVIIGKKNYLYEESYINTYYARDFIGKDKIEEQMQKLHVIQDSLESYGVDFLLVFAPGKASFYPEYIPDKYDNSKSTTNHQYFVAQAKSMGINHIDFSSWFISLKDTSTYCLYPKTGIHWSYYGMNLATDSLVTYIENLRNIDMPDLIWKTIELKSDLFGVDKDIEEGMNLLFPISNFAMPYPEINIVQDKKIKPKTIVIADSFYWQLHNAGYSKSLFDAEFWFYFNQIYPPRNENKLSVKDLDLLDEFYQREVIILMCTEPFLKRNFWGFIDECYAQVTHDDSREKEIQSIISRILSNDEWAKSVREKADEKQIEFEEMLRLDAEYIYNKSQSQNKLKTTQK